MIFYFSKLQFITELHPEKEVTKIITLELSSKVIFEHEIATTSRDSILPFYITYILYTYIRMKDLQMAQHSSAQCPIDHSNN